VARRIGYRIVVWDPAEDAPIARRADVVVASPERARALGKPVSRGGANRARAAHDHVFDGPRGLAKVAGGNNAEFVRQEPLLNQQNGIAPDVKGHGAVMTGATVDGDIQAISTLIFRILLSMLR
jgi:hypothetical protein